ncbi:YqzG/YhdC family protein [Brevibacillus sp. NRS-1366]|uniref:YqzG/YhdC family protein n=1 Tax=Brevibacillus sp. NRS-1366 TaxID=3233899 RepID=UPI003D24EFF8
MVAILLTITFATPTDAQPPYAKWGRIAMQETKQKYPHEQIVDYLHVGRIQKTPTTSEETFKLLLQEGNRRRALLVHIEFESRTEKVVRISFEETRV